MSIKIELDTLLEDIEGNPSYRAVQQKMLEACLQGKISVEKLMVYLVENRDVPIRLVICDIKCHNLARALQFARLGSSKSVSV